jgi:hypothetical protein
MTTLRASRNGEFNDAYLLIEYPAENFAGGGNAQEAKQPVAIDAGAKRRARTALAPTVNLAAHGRPLMRKGMGEISGNEPTRTNERPITSNSDLRPVRLPDSAAVASPISGEVHARLGFNTAGTCCWNGRDRHGGQVREGKAVPLIGSHNSRGGAHSFPKGRWSHL